MNILHFDCFAGISGDMALGALVGLGVDPAELTGELRKLGLSGWTLEFAEESRAGIRGTRAKVALEDGAGGGADGHAHAHWGGIRALLERAPLREGAKRRALDIFGRLARAEAEVHGTAVDDVRFHEVGALDSIIDIAGAGICLDILRPGKITAGPVELGGGAVRCAHGVLPVPAPAVLKLCAGMPLRAGGFDREMTTPTGAAILAACVDEFVSGPAAFVERGTAYGIGARDHGEKPNVLRLSWREEPGEKAAEAGAAAYRRGERLGLLETNIDDMTGEELAFLMEELFAAGALDVTLTPCVMKKGRPATTVAALCAADRTAAVKKALFEKSSAAGVKLYGIERVSLRRREERRRTARGIVRVKTLELEGGGRGKIEYEDRARVAREAGVSLAEAGRLLEREAGDGR